MLLLLCAPWGISLPPRLSSCPIKIAMRFVVPKGIVWERCVCANPRQWVNNAALSATASKQRRIELGTQGVLRTIASSSSSHFTHILSSSFHIEKGGILCWLFFAICVGFWKRQRTSIISAWQRWRPDAPGLHTLKGRRFPMRLLVPLFHPLFSRLSFCCPEGEI